MDTLHNSKKDWKKFIYYDLDLLTESYDLTNELENATIIFSQDGKWCHDGRLLLIYEKDGKLYEQNDYHCSCNGYDNWEPEETTLEALKKRVIDTDYHSGDLWSEFLTQLEGYLHDH